MIEDEELELFNLWMSRPEDEYVDNGRIIKHSDVYWIFYIDKSKESELDPDRCGKWMYFFAEENRDHADELCRKAVTGGVCIEAKYSTEYQSRQIGDDRGLVCLYLNGDDIDTHRRVIRFMLENRMIQKTKTGRYYNMPFKYDSQTKAGEYRDTGFKAQLRLSDLIDLYTGEWIYSKDKNK